MDRFIASCRFREGARTPTPWPTDEGVLFGNIGTYSRLLLLCSRVWLIGARVVMDRRD
jgi:hypothetical protein